MNKFLKGVLATFVSSMLILPLNALASNQQIPTGNDFNEEIFASEKTKELTNMFPGFEKHLRENTNGVLAGEQDVYIRYTPKENTKVDMKNLKTYSNEEEISKDYIVEYFTKQEYEDEIQKAYKGIGIQSIGPVEQQPCSWLNLDVQVYYGNFYNDFLAYNFCSWKTRPIFHFTDGIGISVSEGLIISGDINSRYSEYIAHDYGSPVGRVYNASLEINAAGNGVLAEYPLQLTYISPGVPDPDEYHNFMVATGIEWNGNSIDKGRIYGHYLHKQIAIGGISLDPSGVPSLDIGGSSKSHSGSVYVTKWE